MFVSATPGPIHATTLFQIPQTRHYRPYKDIYYATNTGICSYAWETRRLYSKIAFTGVSRKVEVDLRTAGRDGNLFPKGKIAARKREERNAACYGLVHY